MAIININKRYKRFESIRHKDPRHKVYNDGTLDFGRAEKVKRSGKTIERKFKAIDRLPFRIMNVRQQDKEFAYARDMVIDIKVAVPYYEAIDSTHVIRLRDKYYNIVTIDKDRKQGEVFITLQVNDGEDYV